jgi:hypothetical protein
MLEFADRIASDEFAQLGVRLISVSKVTVRIANNGAGLDW